MKSGLILIDKVGRRPPARSTEVDRDAGQRQIAFEAIVCDSDACVDHR